LKGSGYKVLRVDSRLVADVPTFLATVRQHLAAAPPPRIPDAQFLELWTSLWNDYQAVTAPPPGEYRHPTLIGG
jgi:hypothetical protein